MKGYKTRRGNSWRLTVDVGSDPVNGKRRQRTKTIPPGPDGKPLGIRAAEDKLREFVEEVGAGTRSDHSQASLRELFDAYLDVRRANSPGTTAEARRRFNTYVPDHLAKTAVGKITAYTLDQLYLRLLDSGGVCRKREKCVGPCKHGAGQPLAASTVDRLHTDLSAAFAQAVRWGWVKANPCDLTAALAVTATEVAPPDVAEVVAFLAHLEQLGPEQGTLRDFVPLLVETGARPAELCALRVGDVDLDAGRVVIARSFSRGGGGVVKSTKTGRSRTLALHPAIVGRLRERRSRLSREALAAGVAVDDWWWFPAPTDPSRPVWASSVSREFREQRNLLGLSSLLTLRNLRHWVASTLLAEGVDVRTTAGRLGHGANVTLGVYAHVLAPADDAAAGVVSLVLERARRKAEG